jgi:putative membrane protein
MSFWKKNVSGEETTPVVDKKAQKAEAKKAKDSLALVIDETEPGAALDLIRSNQNWLLPNGVGVILSLPVDAPVDEGGIGGLGKISAKGNEDKGSILQRIANDKIQVFETQDMLRHNILGIIPTEQSLGPEGMGEYTLFDGVIFMLTSVDIRADGSISVNPIHYNESTESTDIPAGDKDTVTLEQAQSISSGAVSLASFIPSLWRRLGGEVSVESADEIGETEDINTVTNTSDESVDNVDNLPDFDPDEIPDDDMPLDDDLPSDEGIYDDDDDVEDPFKDLDADSESETNDEATVTTATDGVMPVEDDRVFNREAVRDTMARRFLDEDLGFTVDMTPFEALFGREVENPTGFSLDHLDNENWLDGQIKLLSQQANDKLADQRRRNIDELRDLFFSLVSNTGDEIAAKMSTEAGAENVWAQTLAEANVNAQKSRDALVDIIGAQRAAIIANYEQKREESIHAEMVGARARYDTYHKPALDRELSELEPTLRASIDDTYAIRRREILDARKASAQASFDASITKVMDYLIEKRSEQVTREAELMEQFRIQMGEFLDENRKEDIARAEALREQLARQNVIEEKTAEFAVREKELYEQIARERDEAQKRLSASQEETDKLIARMREENETALTQAQAEIQRANERTAEEAARVNVVREEISRQFESQIASQENDKNLLIAQINRESLTAKRANRLYVALAVLVALAFLAVGVIAGILLNTAMSSGVGGAMVMPWTAQVHTVADSVASIGGIGA